MTHNKGMVRARTQKPTRQSREEEDLLTSLLRSSLFGLMAFCICGILLLFAVTAFAYAQPDPLSFIPPLSLAALLASSFTGGFVCQKKRGGSPLLSGLVLGAICVLLIIFLSAICQGLARSSFKFWQSLVLHCLSVVFTILGSAAGSIKRRRKPNKRRFGN